MSQALKGRWVAWLSLGRQGPMFPLHPRLYLRFLSILANVTGGNEDVASMKGYSTTIGQWYRQPTEARLVYQAQVTD
jgi:hypothetical protein